ncbi:uncharacterized protein LTR77_000010 [Saxophila tyrrhenica]|uniref:Urea carboxylase n=1 Tax=Saxophila tyrrhenica TaxID=1690608 RepID=A0AAV9PLI7_9PEZI|nr:hypothetical protein LTR77_000010 [Saxophila tyrrhenica]
MSSGATLTNMLDKLTFEPFLVEFTDGGMYTTIQDFPGRTKARSGVPVSGPMDSFSLRVANMLVGNAEGTAGFEITYSGPTMFFHQPAVIALCGASMDFKINGVDAAMWTRLSVPRLAEVAIGTLKDSGCRAYLAILGGLPNAGSYLGSKSTTPALKWGGYQGRTLRAGDVLAIDEASSQIAPTVATYQLPESLVATPDLQRPIIYTLAGPFDTEEFLTPEGRKDFFDATWKVGISSGRTGIRLDGPPPEWARESGGEGGSHPSNVLGFGYPIGGLSFTGNSAVIFTADSPLQSGFICLQTILSCELWRLGQLKAGDEIRFAQCNWSQAVDLEKQYNMLYDTIRQTILAESSEPTMTVPVAPLIDQPHVGSSTLFERKAQSTQGEPRLPRFLIRQAGDRGLLCEFGAQEFDLRVRLRIQQIVQQISEQPPPGVSAITRPHTMTVLINYDPAVASQTNATSVLVEMEAALSDSLTFHGTKYYLPMVFDPEENKIATQRYMETLRPYATYLPDNIDFIRRNNGLESRDDVLAAVERNPFLVLAASGYMGLPVMISIDPRKRLTVPKTNPSRATTPAGALGTGGNTIAVYPVESPGGYMLWGLTLLGAPFDTFGSKPGYTAERPWLFKPFDQIELEAVPREEFDAINKEYQQGTYKIRSEPIVLSMADYDALVEQTKDEVEEIQRLQKAGAAAELAKENELLEKWHAEQTLAASKKAEQKEANAEQAALVRATVNARIWKINVAAGDEVERAATVVVLEAMKMEIAIQAPGHEAAYIVSSVTKEVGEIVEPGDLLLSLKPN